MMSDANREAIKKRVVQVIVEELDVPIEQVLTTSRLRADLNMDDLGDAELQFGLEIEFDIDILEGFENMVTVGDVVVFVARQLERPSDQLSA